MWNYSIPYRLKHWIDLVVQVGASVLVNDKFEYVGQITDRPLQMVLSSGSPYEMRFPLESDGVKIDFQRAYLPGPALEEALTASKAAARDAAKAF